jgi:hypothetical protein
MARGKRRGSRGGRLAAAIVLCAISAGLIWWYLHSQSPVRTGPLHSSTTSPPASNQTVNVAVDRVDARNDGHRVRVSGELRPAAPVRDPQFGIAVDAIVLEREVRMLQWQEHCAGTSCSYALAWSDHAVDSRAFRDAQAHRNGTPFPFSSRRFTASELRLGAYAIDPALAASDIAPERYPVSVARLPPNLAATFRDCDGAVCSGDPSHPVAGDLRVEYRTVAAGPRTLEGIQQGNRLQAAH